MKLSKEEQRQFAALARQLRGRSRSRWALRPWAGLMLALGVGLVTGGVVPAWWAIGVGLLTTPPVPASISSRRQRWSRATQEMCLAPWEASPDPPVTSPSAAS